MTTAQLSSPNTRFVSVAHPGPRAVSREVSTFQLFFCLKRHNIRDNAAELSDSPAHWRCSHQNGRRYANPAPQSKQLKRPKQLSRRTPGYTVLTRGHGTPGLQLNQRACADKLGVRVGQIQMEIDDAVARPSGTHQQAHTDRCQQRHERYGARARPMRRKTNPSRGGRHCAQAVGGIDQHIPIGWRDAGLTAAAGVNVNAIPSNPALAVSSNNGRISLEGG